MSVWPAKWTQHHVGDRNVIELEGKTKSLLASLDVMDGEGMLSVPLIPEFQGAWMRVRITVELIPCEDDEEGG